MPDTSDILFEFQNARTDVPFALRPIYAYLPLSVASLDDIASFLRDTDKVNDATVRASNDEWLKNAMIQRPIF